MKYQFDGLYQHSNNKKLYKFLIDNEDKIEKLFPLLRRNSILCKSKLRYNYKVYIFIVNFINDINIENQFQRKKERYKKGDIRRKFLELIEQDTDYLIVINKNK